MVKNLRVSDGYCLPLHCLPYFSDLFLGPGVDFINGFAPLRPTFAPCAQLLRSFLLAQMLGPGRKRSAQGAKQFMKWTLGPSAENKSAKILSPIFISQGVFLRSRLPYFFVFGALVLALGTSLFYFPL